MIKETGFAFRDWIFNRVVGLRSLSKVKNDKIIVGFISGTKTGLSGSSKILFEAIADDSRFFAYLVYQESSTRKVLQNTTSNAYYRRAFSKISLFLKTDIWITTH